MSYADNPALGDRIAIIEQHHDAAVHAENERLRAELAALKAEVGRLYEVLRWVHRQANLMQQVVNPRIRFAPPPTIEAWGKLIEGYIYGSELIKAALSKEGK